MKIEEMRLKKGITQEELAEELSVDRSTIAKWETGAANPRTDKIPTLAKVLGCEIKELFE